MVYYLFGFCDTIDDNIENFRARVIYQCEEEKIDHHPVNSIFYNLNESEKDENE